MCTHIIYYNQDHAKTSTSKKICIIIQVQHKIPSIYLDMLSSPDGNQIHVIKYSKKKCEIYTQIINSNRIPRYQSWTTHKRIFKPRITYLLDAYSLSHKACKKLQSMFSQFSIVSLGMNRYFPISLRYGNQNYRLLNILHIVTEQLVKKMKSLNLLMNDNNNKNLIITVIDNY